MKSERGRERERESEGEGGRERGRLGKDKRGMKIEALAERFKDLSKSIFKDILFIIS